MCKPEVRAAAACKQQKWLEMCRTMKASVGWYHFNIPTTEVTYQESAVWHTMSRRLRRCLTGTEQQSAAKATLASSVVTVTEERRRQPKRGCVGCAAAGIPALFNTVITIVRLRTDTGCCCSLAWRLRVAVPVLCYVWFHTLAPTLQFPGTLLVIVSREDSVWSGNDIRNLTLKPAKRPRSLRSLNFTLAARSLN